MILAIVLGVIVCVSIVFFSCMVVSSEISELEHPERIEVEEWE